MSDPYASAHKHRLEWMPWLWHKRSSKQRAWADPWQAEVQAALCAVEQIQLGSDVFIAPSAHLFAEPHRDIVLGDRSVIGAEVFAHGPILIGADTSINPRCHLDGGRKGIRIGSKCRIATGVQWGLDLSPTNEVLVEAHHSPPLKTTPHGI